MRRMITPMPHAPMMSGAAGDRVGTRRRGVQGTRLAQTRRDVHPSAHAPVPAEVTGAGVPQPCADRGIEHHGAIDLKRQERIRMACRGQRTRGGPSTEIPRCGRGQPCGRHFAHALGRGRRQAWRADGCCPLTRRRSTWALLGVEDQASAWSALATGRGDHGAWVPSVHRAAPTSAARRPPTKNCPHPIGPREFYSGWSCAHGEKSLGRGDCHRRCHASSQDRRGGLGVVSFVSSHDHGRP